ncbi:MAG: ABC transporter ATP-binding protein [Bdellovibrionota bacterium]
MWFRKIYDLLPQIKGMLFKALAFALTIEALKLVPPYLMKIAIDLLLVPNPILETILITVTGVLAASILTTIIEDKFILLSALNVFNLETGILKKAHNKLLSLGLKYHESNPSGELVHLMNKGASRLAELMWFVQDQFLGAFLQIILTSILLLFVHFEAGLVFIFFLPIVIYLIHRTGKKVQPYREHYHGVFQEAAWEMNQSLLNIRTVKDFVQEKSEHKKYTAMLDRFLKLADIRIRVENRDNRNRDILLGIARFSVLFYVVYLVYIGEITAGTLVLFATLSEKVISSLFRLGRLYSHLGDAMESINQFTELFEEKADIVDSPGAVSCPDKMAGEIVFDNVSFAYLKREEVLSGIDLEIPPRSIVAFVGRSGAGKSTMVKLIGRHYDIDSGSIKIDGIDIRNLKVNEYRRKISVVSQSIEIFDASVADNIAYGTKASLEEIERVAHAAHAHEFIAKMPQAYQTRVGEKGVKLSGGQRQRIGIARALIMNPAVLIFDEATSSLDTESERLIQSALKDIARKQTMIIIAHRLSTIESADMVVVFDEGKIVEIGSQEELISQRGVFAQMKKLQALGAIRE